MTLSLVPFFLGGRDEAKGAEAVVTSAESLQCLVLQVHRHGQRCPFPPALQPSGAVGGKGEGRRCRGKGEERRGVADVPPDAGPMGGREGSEEGLELCLRYTCQAGHGLAWRPSGTAGEGCGVSGGTAGAEAVSPSPTPSGERGRRRSTDEKREGGAEEACCSVTTRRSCKGGSRMAAEGSGQRKEEEETVNTLRTAETGEIKTSGKHEWFYFSYLDDYFIVTFTHQYLVVLLTCSYFWCCVFQRVCVYRKCNQRWNRTK